MNRGTNAVTGLYCNEISQSTVGNPQTPSQGVMLRSRSQSRHRSITLSPPMQPSTLVLLALLNLNTELTAYPGLCTYVDSSEGTLKLLEQLWDIYRESPKSYTTVGFLTETWYEKHYIASDILPEGDN